MRRRGGRCLDGEQRGLRSDLGIAGAIEDLAVASASRSVGDLYNMHAAWCRIELYHMGFYLSNLAFTFFAISRRVQFC